MRTVVVAGVALASLGWTSAFGADMAVKAPLAPAPVANWTGCYLGGNLGGAWARSKWTYRNINPFDAPGPGGPILATNNTFDMSSVIGGVQGGCNYEFSNNVVIGIEGTWSGTQLHKTQANVVQIFGPPFNQTVSTSIDSIVTVAGRLGYAFAPNWLGYVRGGYASAEIGTSGVTQFAPTFSWASSHRNNGFVAGAGLEYMFTPHVIVGAEFNYYGLGTYDQSGFVSGAPANPVVHGVNANIESVTGRLSFLFRPGK